MARIEERYGLVGKWLETVNSGASSQPTQCIQAPGLQGPPGPPGRDGRDGRDGTDGRNGQDGLGQPGATGVAGNPGPRGIQGEAGPKGQPGLFGLKGDVGPRGLPGQNGLQGPSSDFAKVAFSAYRDSGSVSSGNFIDFNNIVENIGGAFSVTGAFTCEQPGWYLFTFNAETTSIPATL